jgi:hypothetical protein
MKRTHSLPRSFQEPLETGGLEAWPLRVGLCSFVARSLGVVLYKRFW